MKARRLTMTSLPAAVFGMLLAAACDNPAALEKADSDSSTGKITLAQFNAIRVDLEGNEGMTPAQVIQVICFNSEQM